VAVCQVCGKHTMFGRNIRHSTSGRWERKAHATSRTFEPNIHKQRVVRDGKVVKINICTRCLRTETKSPAV
jgi:large subunit ribosomal protein L28